MQFVGLFYGVGAFLAGLLLVESTYRTKSKQILNLSWPLIRAVFMAVGLGINWSLIAEEWNAHHGCCCQHLTDQISSSVFICKTFGSEKREAAEIGALMAQAVKRILWCFQPHSGLKYFHNNPAIHSGSDCCTKHAGNAFTCSTCQPVSQQNIRPSGVG